MNRRSFLGSTATATAAAAAGALRVTAQTSSPAPALRAAVIGSTGHGDYGHGLDGIFTGRPGITCVAVADPNDTARKAAAKRIGAPRDYADYHELLERERPQLVSIAMRHADRHHEIGLACLRAGAHCYFEKPFAQSSDEADALLAEADRRNLRIAVAHTMRFVPRVRRLREAVASGRLGEIAEFRAYGKQDARAGGEDMMVLGSHLFDLLRAFAGDPLWVQGQVTVKGRPITREDRRKVTDNVGWLAGDRVAATFGFAGGATATFLSDARLRETVGHWGIEIHGSRGVARLNCDIAPNVFLRSTTGWSPTGRRDDWQPFEPAPADAPPSPEHNLGPVGDWLEAIRTDREPECSGRNGAWAVEMVMGVYASSLAGRRMAFPLEHRKHPLGD
jgi:predicted dehydrogenase